MLKGPHGLSLDWAVRLNECWYNNNNNNKLCGRPPQYAPAL